MADGIPASFFHAVSPWAMAVQVVVRRFFKMLAPSTIVYNTVIDIIFRIENYFGLAMLRAAPDRRTRRPNRGNDDRKTFQTGGSSNV
jgi:hypothetical protein